MKTFCGLLKSAFVALSAAVVATAASAAPLLPWNFQGSNVAGSTYTVNFFGEFQTDGDGVLPTVAQQITGFWNGASIVGRDPALGDNNFGFDNLISLNAPYFPGRGMLFTISDPDEAAALDILDGDIRMAYIGSIGNRFLVMDFFLASTGELRTVEVEATLRREAICDPLVQTCGGGGTVPEPAMLTLVLAALMGLAFQRRKGVAQI